MRRGASAIFLIAIGVIGTVLGLLLIRLGLEKASQWASVFGFVLAIPALVLAVIGVVQAASSDRSEPTSAEHAGNLPAPTSVKQKNIKGHNILTTGSGSVHLNEDDGKSKR